jgi:hypothetical protein
LRWASRLVAAGDRAGDRRTSETAGGYLKSAGIGLRSSGGWGHPSPAKAAIEVITDSGLAVTLSEQDGQRSVSACAAYGELIALELSRGRNAMGIWQDLVDGHGFAGGYQSVKRFVRKLLGAVPPEARSIIETRPGEECQVDYGTGPMVRDPDSGKYRGMRLFVLTLGCSRKSVRVLVFRSSAGVGGAAREGKKPSGIATHPQDSSQCFRDYLFIFDYEDTLDLLSLHEISLCIVLCWKAMSPVPKDCHAIPV